MLSEQQQPTEATAAPASSRSANGAFLQPLTPLNLPAADDQQQRQPPGPERDALDSPGSSISSSLQREYDSLLSYAVPHFGIQLDLQQQQLEEQQQQQPSARKQQQQSPPPIPPLPTQSELARATQQLRPTVQNAQNGDAEHLAALDVEDYQEEANEAEEEDAEEEGTVTPSQLSEDFDPTKTQLIEGLGNTGNSLMESLKAVRSNFDTDADQQQQQLYLSPPLTSLRQPQSLLLSQRVEQAFESHPQFEQDLSGLLHASSADYRLSQTLGRWCEDLSRRMMEANHRVKLDLRDRAERLVREEKARLLVDMRNLRDENDRLREAVTAHRAALTAKEVELEGYRERLVNAHERIRAARCFADWRARLEAARREAAHEKLAEQHYRRALARRALAAWKGRLETTWRQLVERGCQEKAMRVCEELGAECEDKVMRLQSELEAVRSELRREREERELAEASMREALMRGVSALNMEAMRAFGGGTSGVNNADVAGESRREDRGSNERDEAEDDDSKPMTRSPRPSSRGPLPVQAPTAPPPASAAVTVGRRQQHQSPVRSQSARGHQQQQQQPRQRGPILVQSDLPGGGLASAAHQSQRQATSVRVEKHARPASANGGSAGMSATLPNFCSPSVPTATARQFQQQQQQQQQQQRATVAYGRYATADQHIRFID